MKRLLLLVVFAAIASPQYAGPRTVYILPMAAGLDQYIAQWLTRDHTMQVVADPKAAEVVMTDRLGDAFEQKLAQIHPAEKKSDSSDQPGTSAPNAFRSSRGRGTIFIVDAKSRQVLWSAHEKPPKSNSDADLNRTAERIAKQLSPKSSSGK
jgi:hypothetical protein